MAATSTLTASDPHGIDPAWWAAQLGTSFRRVVVFVIRGKIARVAAQQGTHAELLGFEVSLRDPTPLRWSLEAASPLVLAGRAPGGEQMAALLGLSAPRALAIVPLVASNRVMGFVYADCEQEALGLPRVSEVFAACHRALVGQGQSGARPTRHAGVDRTRRGPARVSRRGVEAGGVTSTSTPTPTPTPTPTSASTSATVSPAAGVIRQAPPPLPRRESGEAAELETFSAMVAESLGAIEGGEETVLEEHPHPGAQGAPRPLPQAGEVGTEIGVVTPGGVVPLSEVARHRTRWGRVLVAACAAGVLLATGGALNAMAPVRDQAGTRNLTIPPQASVQSIAQVLEDKQLVRSADAFQALARVSGLDRDLRAGVYELPAGAWAFEILRELERGQVHHVQVTVPEGLSLREIANLLEHHGVASAGDVVQAARDPELLQKFDIRGASAEGFLFPETYTFARGVSAHDVVETMLEQFFVRIAVLPEAVRASPEMLFERVTLAAIIEEEARDKNEQARISGVFKNRLERNMKLESCATVQYVLGHTKERLTLTDVRKPSPYNTYLNLGLPPGPIASPGMGALKAAFRPESHGYLFFFAREDGSHQHIFTTNYADHMKAQRLSQK